jgi:UDP-GlcNAc:undecaprenyl-phosphate GlcNAc-1-phosphate transferase
MNIKKKLDKTLQEISENIKRHSKNKFSNFFTLNVFIVLAQVLYINLRYAYLNETIPLWYTKMWGDYQLAPKFLIFVIPLISFCIVLLGLLLALLLNKFFIRYIQEVLFSFVTASNILLAVQAFAIIRVSSIPFKPLINPLILDLLWPFFLAFLGIYALAPAFVDYAEKHGLVTNPDIHEHPGMVLKGPSVRGGGFIYALVFLVVSVLFLGVSREFSGMYLALILLSVLGLLDDYQNTHPRSSFRALESPVLRLFLLCVVVSLIALSGINIDVISNSLRGILNLQGFGALLPNGFLPVVSGIFTVIWIVWVMNILSWSNGVDGQFSGIVGIASIITAILSLRFVPLGEIHKNVALMAAVSAGASLALVRYTWHPSKMMWGFGAVSAGLVLATLSILSQSKITTSVLVILIPFLDAVVTFLRRIFQGKNPMKGDRGHLHHLLLDRGWSVQKIAVFYWGTTAFFGLMALAFSEKYLMQVAMILGGVAAFFIVIMNLRSIRGKEGQPKAG